MRIRMVPLWLAVVAALLAQDAYGSLLTVYSTGVDNFGNPLPNLSSDPHYTLLSYPIGITTPVVPTTFSVFGPVSGPGVAPDAWLDPTDDLLPGGIVPKSTWIAQNDNDPSHFGADYTNPIPPPSSLYTFVYETTFYVPSDFASGVISGYWSADNFGADIIINTTSTGQTTFNGAPTNSFASWTPFSITSGFIPGATNSLRFVVYNNSISPQGLRVEILSASYTPIIPEPTSMALLGTGLVGLAFLRRRNRASTN